MAGESMVPWSQEKKVGYEHWSVLSAKLWRLRRVEMIASLYQSSSKQREILLVAI